MTQFPTGDLATFGAVGQHQKVQVAQSTKLSVWEFSTHLVLRID